MRMTFSDDHGNPEGVPFPEEALKLTERGPDGVLCMADWTGKFRKRIGHEVVGCPMPPAAHDIICALEHSGPYFDGRMLALPGESPERCANRLGNYLKNASWSNRDPVEDFKRETKKALDVSGSGCRPSDVTGEPRGSRPAIVFDPGSPRSHEARPSGLAYAGPTPLADAANRALWGIGLFLLGAFCGLVLHSCAA